MKLEYEIDIAFPAERPTGLFAWLARILARRGYVVIPPNRLRKKP